MQIVILFITWVNLHPLRLSRRHWRRTYQRKHQSQHQRSQPCNQRQFFNFLRISHHFKSTPIFQFFKNISLLLQLGTNLIIGHCPIVICQLKRKFTIVILFLNIQKRKFTTVTLVLKIHKIRIFPTLIWVLKNPPWSHFLRRSTYSSEQRSQGHCCNPFGMIASSTSMFFCVL